MKIKILSCFYIIFFILANINLINTTLCSPYNNTEVLVINGVLSYPEILDKDHKLTQLDENYITPLEFLKILKSLYQNDYILVKMKDVLSSNPVQSFPADKKPIVLAINNVAYGQVGEVNKLIIERNNKIASYTSKQAINQRINYDKEFITILEDFINTHPNFSHKNAKGMIIVNGHKGILGYKTQKTNANSKFQIKKCSEVIEHLNNNNWEFCASSYTSKNSNNSNLEFASDLNNWINNVRPILPKTSYYFLNNNIDNLTDFEYKSQLLLNSDFNTLLSTEMTQGIYHSSLFDKGKIINVKRVCGETLRNHREKFLPMFDSEIIYDRINRSAPFW